MTLRRTLLALLLAVAAGLAAGPAPRVASADDPTPAKPPETPAAPPVAEPPSPDAKIRGEVVRIIDELRAEASQIRGLPWKTKVEADLITRKQLMQRLESLMKEDFDAKKYERDLKALRRLGLLTDKQDPMQMAKEYLGAGIQGYYDPKTKKLYLIDGITGDAQRPPILHELVHALEDQYIDLQKLDDTVKDDSDKSFAMHCVMEGSAETARGLYEQAHPLYGRMYRDESAKSAGDSTKAIQEMPEIIYLDSQLHYMVGPAFVGRYLGRGAYVGDSRGAYATGMAKLYEDIPTSQEQVMHPGKFVGEHRDLPRTVVWPEGLAGAAGEGWKELERQGVGELDFALWLDRWLGGNQGKLDANLAASGRFWSDAARVASEGWDGAWMQMLEKDGDPRAYSIASAWDSPKDAQEAGEAMLAALKAQYGAKFKAGAWAERDGVRTANYEGAYGLGRIEIRADEVRLVDGLPLDALDRVFALLETARLGKDPKDTWSPENAPDLSQGAAWKSVAAQAAWSKPSPEWTVTESPALTKTGTPITTLTKGALEMQVQVHSAGLLLVLAGAVSGLGKRYTFDLQSSVSELHVGGKTTARIEFESAPKAGGGAKDHVVVILVALGAKTLVVRAMSDASKWEGIGPEFEAGLAGFYFWD